MNIKRIPAVAIIGFGLMLYSASAAAQLTNQGMLDQVVSAFATRAASWQTVIMNAATWLFWTLGMISLVWTGATLLLRGGGIQDFFSEFVRFIMFFGFFLWLLRNGPAFASSIIQSLQLLGERASGVSSVTPSGIVDIGFMIWRQAVSNLTIWSPVDSLVGVALSIAITVILALVAVNMLLVLVSAWILMYAGIFFLGFGGSRWTSDMAIGYYRTVLGVAVQLMTMVILVGIGVDLLNTFYAKMNKGTLNFDELGVMLVFCITLLLLVNRVPQVLASIVSGGGVGAATGVGSYGAGSAMAGAAMASAAAGMAGGAAFSAANNIAGGASAIKAAFAQAGQDAAATTAAPLAMAAAGGGSSAGDGGAGGGGGGGTPSSTPFALAAGLNSSGGGASVSSSAGRSSSASSSTTPKDSGAEKGGQTQGSNGGSQSDGMSSGSMPGRVAAAGANLAAGIGAVIASKAEQMATNFQAGVDQTFGGQVAAAIRASGDQDQPTFTGDGFSALTPEAEEIAAFVNRTEH